MNTPSNELPILSPEQALILEAENQKYKACYLWFTQNMPKTFFEEVDPALLMLIVHHMMEFKALGYFSTIQLKQRSIVICLDEPDADLKVLKGFVNSGIQDYQTYISNSPFTFLVNPHKIRVVLIHFYGAEETTKPYQIEFKQNLRQAVKEYYPRITDADFEKAFEGIRTSLLHAIPLERAVIAIAMFYRSVTRDKCQYEVIYNEELDKPSLDKPSPDKPAMEIVLAWRNTPRHHFLFRLAHVIQRHGIAIKRLNASYNQLYRTDSILVVSLELDGLNDRSILETTNILDFVKELTTIKYFESFDQIDRLLVQPKVISGNMGNLLRAMLNWIHQGLVQLDVNLYSFENIEEGLCRHPELTAQICEAFKFKFDPLAVNLDRYHQIKNELFNSIEKLDTGHQVNDIRRKNILRLAVHFVEFALKTNFYRPNYSALSFRFDPKFLDQIPFDRSKKFPEMPYAIIFIKGMHYFGFHIRFKDLARGGLRTVFPEFNERLVIERNTVLNECYNLALTQHMKNKDIPEGGAKGIILLRPFEHLEAETLVLRQELQQSFKEPEVVERQLEAFRQGQRLEYLYQAQRSFIESLVTIVNSDADGHLKAKDILDYWGRPENLYLGPDENLHDLMIEWIADYSKKHHYKPGSSFISSKPKLGINHKEYGVTSLGVNVYLDALLHYMKIDPQEQVFTVKMSGGPDGDVAGNEILILHRLYPNTAKIVALTDISGTIYDPNGLDLEVLATLVHQGKSIKHYPPEKLNENGYLVDKFTKRFETPLVQLTLCWRNIKGHVLQEWLSGSDMNHLVRHNVHQTVADIFIPAGGRPRTLNESNYKEFLDATGKPTAKAIVEGANLYLTNGARRSLEELGVLIIKDSSANKAGVICSSFEVLSGLTLGDEGFLKNKPVLIQEILTRLNRCAANEAALLLKTHAETGDYLTDISDKISKRINQFTDQLLAYLENQTLSQSPHDPLIRCFLSYCLPVLRQFHQKALLQEIPVAHKKAIIACHIAAQTVYAKGLFWFPSIVDVLPLLLEENQHLD